jgi:hypothetical protein
MQMTNRLIRAIVAVLSVACAESSAALITLTSTSGWEQSLNNGVTWTPATTTSTNYAPGGQSMPSLWPSGIGESTTVRFRISFFLPGAPVSGTLWVAQDDDGVFRVNGTTVFTDMDNMASGYGPFNILGQLQSGMNTFEANVYSTWCCARGFAAYAVIQTAETGGEIPEPSTFGLLASGLGLSALLSRRRKRA